MESPSELELYLRDHQAAGQVDSSGRFTVSREEALRKLASFQLPFETAWAVKVIQCAVRDCGEQPIRVDLTSTETRFYFHSQTLELQSVEDGFYDPDPHPDLTIRHLLSALWVVGLNQGRTFHFTVPESSLNLMWDGTGLHKVPKNQNYSCTYLAVSHRGGDGDGALGWVKTVATAGKRNADLLSSLSENGFTCPVPLTVDGRRLDSLHHCPGHGWGETSYPLAVGFCDGDLPPVRIPKGTYEMRPSPSDPRGTKMFTAKDHSGHGFRALGEKALEQAEYREDSALPYLLTIHMEHVKKGDNHEWRTCRGQSQIYWVCDGVVVHKESLVRESTTCTLGVFVNACDLPTDLTSLRLSMSEERERRANRALALLQENLYEPAELTAQLESMIKKGTWRGRVGAGLVAMFGVGLFFASPVQGVLCVAGGVFYGIFAGTSAITKVSKFREGFEELYNALNSSGAGEVDDPL